MGLENPTSVLLPAILKSSVKRAPYLESDGFGFCAIWRKSGKLPVSVVIVTSPASSRRKSTLGFSFRWLVHVNPATMVKKTDTRCLASSVMLTTYVLSKQINKKTNTNLNSYLDVESREEGTTQGCESVKIWDRCYMYPEQGRTASWNLIKVSLIFLNET